MARPAEELLEFDQLKDIVGGFTTCGLGRRAAEALAFRRDLGELNTEFALVREATEWLRDGSELGFGALIDPDTWFGRLAVPASVLSPEDLLAAASLLDSVFMLRHTFKGAPVQFARLSESSAALADLSHLSNAIGRAVLPGGEISDDASTQLKRIRVGIAQARAKIQHSLETILRSRGESGGEDYITLRNDRYVIPVRALDRRGVPGVVHAASATGQTVFVEPLEAIDLNNRLVQLGEEESAEVSRILRDLTDRLHTESGPLEAAIKSIAHFDSIFARARFAREFDCAIPDFSETSWLRLDSARNPVLEAALRPRGRHAVALSLALGGTEPIMVISGPNTGGKTVALKTVGLAALSAQSAIPVAASRAEMPLFDRVLTDIGDEQSIAADLSTFSAHILNLKSMLDVATDRSLILVDEMGTGTAPEEGAALAVALLEEFRMRRALTLASTHHDRLKAYASTTPGIVNAAMEFDEIELRPTYRLLVGVPGTSSGIEIARRLGLPERVVQHAQTSLSPETREARDLIAYLHRSRFELEEIKQEVRDQLAALESARSELQNEWVGRQKKRISELEKNFGDMQKQFEQEVARLVADVKDRSSRAQLEKLTGRRLSKIVSEARAEGDAAVVETLAASQNDLGVTAQAPRKPVAPEQLQAGDRVAVKGFKQPVIFRRHDGRMAEVEAGALRMRVTLADILSVEPNSNKPKPLGDAFARPQEITVHVRASHEPAAQEINVIGCTVEEAIRRVDKFIDVAVLDARSNVRIIHGYGTGALRRGLSQFLTEHPLVEGVHAEGEDRGGAAVTVAELKS